MNSSKGNDLVGANLSALEAAKQLLKELQSYQIGLEDILKEGFDSRLLRTVYAQTGIRVNPPTPPQQRLSISNVKGNQGTDGFAGTGNEPQHAFVEPSGGSLSAVSAVHRSPSNRPSSVEVGKAPSPAQANQVGNKTVDLKGVDRKEYIARQLAAKRGKGAATVSNAATSVTTLPTGGVESKISVAPAKEESVEKPIKSQNISSDSVADAIQSQDLDFEAKRKAQTDLARQKIEALKAQREIQIQTRTSDLDSRESLLPEKPKPTEGADASFAASPAEHISATGATPPRRDSYFSPVSRQSAFSLPGLFSTAGVTNSTNINYLENKATSSENRESPKDTEFKSPAHTSVDAQRSLQLAHAPEVKDTLQGMRPSRKRHHAADFIDSPPNKMKKSMSQSEDTSVIINVSDNESDEEEDNHTSETALPTQLKPGELQLLPGLVQDAIRKTPQNLGKFRSSSEVPTGRHLVPDSASTSKLNQPIPNQAQEPEILKSKEIEIEQMNRKIAELEQRIKQKQVSSRGQSPVVSTESVALNNTVDKGHFLANDISRAQKDEPILRDRILEEASGFSSRDPTDQAETSDNNAADNTSDSAMEIAGNEGLPETPTKPRTELTPNITVNYTSGQQLRQTAKDYNMEENADGVRKAQLQQELEVVAQEISTLELTLQTHLQEVQLTEEKLTASRELLTHLSHELSAASGAIIASTDTAESSQSDVAERDDNLGAQTASPEIEQHLPAIQSSKPPPSDPSLLDEDPATDENLNIEDEEIGPSAEDVDEDGMDISHSDMEDGELSPEGHEDSSDLGEAMDLNDDEELYEPPSEVGSPQETPRISQERPEDISLASARDSPVQNDVLLNQNGATEEMLEEGSPLTQQSLINDDPVGPNSEQKSTTMNSGDNSDDYEPPEPSPKFEDAALSTVSRPKPGSQMSDVNSHQLLESTTETTSNVESHMHSQVEMLQRSSPNEVDYPHLLRTD